LGSDFALLRFDPKVEVGGRVAAAARPSVGRLSSARNNNAKAAEEVADVVIVLCRLMTRMGNISAKRCRARDRDQSHSAMESHGRRPRLPRPRQDNALR
jgi:hypothetical protein